MGVIEARHRAVPAGGEIERVLQGNPLQSSGHAHEEGEWDWLPLVDRRTMRRLTGAGYFARHGLALDEAADVIRQHVAGIATMDDAIEWYIRTALHELNERQRERSGEVAWEDQERPEEEWPDDDDLEPVSMPDDVSAQQLHPDECETVPWDVEPPLRLPAGSRPTFYGSQRPVVRRSCWDSVPDDRLPPLDRRRWWRRLRSWMR